MNTQTLCTLAVLSLGSIHAHGFAIAAPGTEGFLVVAGGGTVDATYEGNSAGYSNDLWLELDGFGNPGMDGILGNDLFIFNNHLTPVGTTVTLGTFASGTELVFRLHVNNTGDDFYSGPASRNADGLPHARVQGEWQPGTTLVSFEDLIGTPEGANGYNDLSFYFTNTRSVSTPDAGTTLLLLGFTLPGLAAIARRVKRKA